MSAEYPALRRSLLVLSEIGVVPLAAMPDAEQMQGFRRSLQATIREEVPAYEVSSNPELLPDQEQHADAHFREVLRLLAGGDVGDFAFVAVHARRRAEQRFPLEALLHSYRCGHAVLSPWVRTAALAAAHVDRERVVSCVADFAIAYTNAVSAVSTAEYVTHTRHLADAEGDRRTQLLQLLLSGYDESDGRVTSLLRNAGYLDQRLTYCVALARSIDPREMENAARAQRIVEALAGAVDGTSIRILAATRDNLATAVFSDLRRQSGWTANRPSLALRVRKQLLDLGPSVVIGVSSDHPSTAFIPRARHEAAVAIDLASVGDRVVSFSDLPIRRLLVHYGGDFVRPALPPWLPELAAADVSAEGALIQTLRALADSDLNVQKAARNLGLHANTIYARLQRIEELTGRDARHFGELQELLLAAECRRM